MINLLYVLAPAICTNCVPVGSWVLALVWVRVPALFINYTMMSCVMLKLDVMNVLCLSTMLHFHNRHHNNPLHHRSILRPTTTRIQRMHQPTGMEIYRGGNDGSQNECFLRLAHFCVQSESVGGGLIQWGRTIPSRWWLCWIFHNTSWAFAAGD